MFDGRSEGAAECHSISAEESGRTDGTGSAYACRIYQVNGRQTGRGQPDSCQGGGRRRCADERNGVHRTGRQAHGSEAPAGWKSQDPVERYACDRRLEAVCQHHVRFPAGLRLRSGCMRGSHRNGCGRHQGDCFPCREEAGLCDRTGRRVVRGIRNAEGGCRGGRCG